MLALYRRSFKELLTYFLVFNLAAFVQRMIDEQSFAFWACIIKKSTGKMCNHPNIADYITSSWTDYWEFWGTFAASDNALLLIPVFFIYFPLLNYCQRHIPNKKAPYILCGIFIGVFIECFMRLLLPKLSGTVLIVLLLISSLLLIIALYKLGDWMDVLTKKGIISYLTKIGVSKPEKWYRIINIVGIVLIVGAFWHFSGNHQSSPAKIPPVLK